FSRLTSMTSGRSPSRLWSTREVLSAIVVVPSWRDAPAKTTERYRCARTAFPNTEAVWRNSLPIRLNMGSGNALGRSVLAEGGQRPPVPAGDSDHRNAQMLLQPL